MNKDQVMSVTRIVVGFASGMLATMGCISSADSSTLTASSIAIAAAVTAIWPIASGIWTHTHDAMIRSVNAADNGRKVVDQSVNAPTVNNAK